MAAFRSYIHLITLFLLCVCTFASTTGINHSSGSTSTSSNSTANSSVTSKTSDPRASTGKHGFTVTNAKHHASPTKHAKHLAMPGSSSPKPSSQPSSRLNSTTNDLDLLPIKPEITPAFGVAGCVLMLTGLAYTMFGIRKEWLHIFFSAAYLVALAVTVLVLYVANPPVPDAIQGAYFVAACVSGCIIGGLSLVFREVTEGLGCLLGGFCLAMWFLVLKPGGLVTSLGGRVAIIASFSVAAWGLAFIKYTKEYGLMFCVAFAGATTVVLGIDCFSRAGLKEFWVYIWDLNDDIFPLFTDTYPMTRGMKVEIAGIVLLFLCGLLSQWKLYKILKTRKEKKAFAQAQDDEAREHLEADIGRRVQDVTDKERALWEQRYGALGEKGATSTVTNSQLPRPSLSQSGFTSATTSRSPSIKDMTVESRELRPGTATEIVEMADLTPVDHVGDVPCGNANGIDSNTLGPTREDNSSTHEMKSINDNSAGRDRVVSEPPIVVPLPFTVTDQELRNRDETESVATAGESAYGDDFVGHHEHGIVNRTIKAVSDTDSLDGEITQLFVPHVEDDRSSIAATLDELTDNEDESSLPKVSRSASPTRRSVVRKSSKPISLRRVGSASNLNKSAISLPDSAISEVKAKRRVSEPPPTDLVELVLSGPETKAPEELSKVLNLKTAQENRRKSAESKGHPSTVASRVSRTPSAASFAALQRMRMPSMAVQKYRTHEWTKYLFDAEQPELGELSPSEEGVRVESLSREVAAPVNVQSLQRTGVENVSGRKSNAMNPAELNDPNSSSPFGSNPSRIVQQPHIGTNPYRSLRSVSNQSVLAPNQSQTKLGGQPTDRGQPVRSASTPTPGLTTQNSRIFTSNIVSQPLVESPVEDIGVQGGATLLSMREDILRKKASTVTLNRGYNMSSQNLEIPSYANSHPALSETASVCSMPASAVDDDNMSLASLKQKMDDDNLPLSRRRSLIQQQIHQGQLQNPYRFSGGSAQSSNPYLQSQQAAWGEPSVRHAAPHQNLIYDSHQPQRGPSVDDYTRQARLASFRQTLRQEAGTNARLARGAEVDEGHRFAMLNEKRHAQALTQQREQEKQMLDTVVDQKMRSGAMLDLHKERLRRMQNQAGNSAGK